MSDLHDVAIVGATGAVGQAFVEILAERDHVIRDRGREDLRLE